MLAYIASYARARRLDHRRRRCRQFSARSGDPPPAAPRINHVRTTLGGSSNVPDAARIRHVALVEIPLRVLHGAMQLDAERREAADGFADLVDAVALRRDNGAFAKLFHHYGPRVRSYFRRLGTNDDVAEELMQDVMLTLWRSAHQFDRSRATVATWLFTIARNRRVDVLRRERRPQVDPTDPLLVGDPGPPADGVVQAEQAERRLREAFTSLPSEQAALVHESFFNDKPHSVIAEELRLPLGTVKSRLRLALAKLRVAMKDHA